MLQPIDRKLTLVIVKSNAEVATVQEREEQMRAQIAALSCEVSLSAIDTVVKLLVLRAKKKPKTRYEYNAERVRDFKVGKEQDEERMGKGFMIPPMKSNTGTSAYLSALVEQPQELSQTVILSQTDVDNKQREIISEESNRALLQLYTKSRVRDMYMEKHISKVQMPLATWSSLSQPHSSRRKANPPTNDKRRRLLDTDGEAYDDEEGNAEEMEDREGSELQQELDQSVVTAQQQTVAAASLPSSSAPAHSLTASHSTPQITADGPAFRYDKQKSKYEYNQERKRDFRYSREKSKQRAKLEEAQSTDKKLTGKNSYADLEEEWGAQTLISLYIRDYDKKVFDNCIKLGSNRFHAADFQHLQKLDLSHQLIGDEQLKRLWAITPTMLQGLENLNLAGNNITDAGMKDFSKVQRSLRSLVQLNLSCNDFGDVGISLLLLEDTYSASLRVLDISFNSLGVLAAYRLATQMFEKDRRAHLEVLFMGGKVRGRTLGDTFIQVFLHAMIQENSRIGLKRLKVLHIPDCNLTTTTIDALSLYLSCDEVALRQLSICQNTINFLPYTPLPRKKCETKAAFFSAILQNSSLHWLLSRQCNLTSSELGILETSLTRNMRNSRLSQDKRKAKPSLDWADQQQLALRSSIAANACETNFYEVIMEETNIWNQKKPNLIKLVPFEITHDIVAEMEHTLSRTTIYSGSGDPDLALNPPLGDVVTSAMRYVNIVLSALEQVREAHVILRTKEDTPHTALLSHKETHNKKGRAEREREEVAQRKELKSFQKQAIDELQRASQQFKAAEREIPFTEERHLAAINNLQDGLLTYRTAASHLRSAKQREEEITTILKRILRNRDMDRRKIAQIQRIASASHDASDNGMYLSVGRVDSPLYSPGRAGTAIWSSRSPPSSPSQMLSPTRGPLDEEELQSRIRAGEEQELDVRATLAEVEAELSICHADTSCCYETLLMGVEDLSAAALEEIFLMQRLVGCFHKTNIINDFWKAAFAEKREDISWALHPYLHKMCPNHRTLDLAAFFAHYWHFHFFRDKEIAKMKQQPQPAEMSPPPTASAADAESMEVIIQ
eukprot:gene23436-31782_t